MSNDIFTIGHSTHPIDEFIRLLTRHRIEVLTDVRSSPFSKFNPQYNKEELKQVLKSNGIRYLFLGKELGARSDDPDCYVHDKVQYDRLARTDLFLSGIDRVVDGASRFRVALMCAEKDPLDCHRTILVARHLVARGCQVVHILASGSTESHSDSMERLLTSFGMSAHDMFRSPEEVSNEAYVRQGGRIAYDRRARRGALDEEDEQTARLGEFR